MLCLLNKEEHHIVLKPATHKVSWQLVLNTELSLLGFHFARPKKTVESQSLDQHKPHCLEKCKRKLFSLMKALFSLTVLILNLYN